MKASTMRLRETAQALFLDALAECTIEQAFSQAVQSHESANGSRLLQIGEHAVELGRVRQVRVIAAGKAAVPMLRALMPHFSGLPGCEVRGVLVTNTAVSSLPPGFQFFMGGHPFPNRASIEGARAVLDMLNELNAMNLARDERLCIFLISGGASAMVELPLDPRVSLNDLVTLYRQLVFSGASIAEINCVRKHFSAVKGGRLGLKAAGGLAYSIFVSDVPAGRLDALASGPTLPDPSTVEDCREVIHRHGLMPHLPQSVKMFFESENLPETPKPGEFESPGLTLLSADDVAYAAKRHAEALGFHTVIDNTCDDWDYRKAGDYLLNRIRELRQQHAKVCLITAGEVTVEMPKSRVAENGSQSAHRPGVGGRNQHLALYMASLLTPADREIAILSAGTDGIDGNSKAAGAVVDLETLPQNSNDGAEWPDSYMEASARAREALERFDSGTFLERAGATVVTGPTGNNLRDLRILLAR